jgi:uncharacterized protein YodC (DUF2158 family)
MAKKDDYEEGDIVQLKSGGPKMTVSDPTAYGGIDCQWFSGSKLSKGRFPPEVLKRADLDEAKKK